MNLPYRIRVTKDYLSFCSAHFITYDGDKCERLHGHNYRLTVEVEGPLDENQYVFDFVTLKKICKEVVDELDHHMLLPTESELIEVRESGTQVRARFRDLCWEFPKQDCVLLPIANTTAELLGAWIGRRILDLLLERHGYRPDVLRAEVEETAGQSARVEFRA